jgi:hypothetical protein
MINTINAANLVQNAVYNAAIEAFNKNISNMEFAPYAAGIAAYNAAYFIFKDSNCAANYAAPIAANGVFDVYSDKENRHTAYDMAWNAVYEWSKQIN